MCRSKRFNFDPRAPCHRAKRSLDDVDLEGIREATNGTAGILCYRPAAPDPAHALPDIRDCGVVQWEEVIEEDLL